MFFGLLNCANFHPISKLKESIPGIVLAIHGETGTVEASSVRLRFRLILQRAKLVIKELRDVTICKEIERALSLSESTIVDLLKEIDYGYNWISI